MPFCENCGSPINEKNKFCGKCGTPVDVAPTYTCNNCGSPIGLGDKFCSVCGNQLNNSFSKPESTKCNHVEDREGYKNLKIDELKILADEGDSNAMAQLGAYYSSLDENSEIDGKNPKRIAVEWFERAALAGNAEGIIQVCYFRSVNTLALETLKGLIDPAVIQERKELYKWFSIGQKLFSEHAPGSENVNLQEFTSDVDKVRYDLAASLFLILSYDEAYNLVANHNDMPSLVLESIINNIRVHDRVLSHVPLSDNDRQELSAALNKMSIILDNDEYGCKPKRQNEDIIYATAATLIADYYCAFEMHTKTVSILKYIKHYTQDEKAKNLLDSELSHYRTDNSGKLKYFKD